MNCTIAHETLARFQAGDLDDEHSHSLEQHLGQCPECRSRLDTLQTVGRTLCLLSHAEPSAETLLNTRHLLSDETRQHHLPEIMTLDDVAEFLHVGPDDLEQIVEKLPAFELAGAIRVRRTRLIEWIEQREHQYLRQTVESRVARTSRYAVQKGA